jgi:hypothetical protein
MGSLFVTLRAHPWTDVYPVLGPVWNRYRFPSPCPVSVQGPLPGFCPLLPLCALSGQPGEEPPGRLGFRFAQKELGPQESATVPGKGTFSVTSPGVPPLWVCVAILGSP